MHSPQNWANEQCLSFAECSSNTNEWMLGKSGTVAMHHRCHMWSWRKMPQDLCDLHIVHFSNVTNSQGILGLFPVWQNGPCGFLLTFQETPCRGITVGVYFRSGVFVVSSPISVSLLKVLVLLLSLVVITVSHSVVLHQPFVIGSPAVVCHWLFTVLVIFWTSAREFTGHIFSQWVGKWTFTKTCLLLFMDWTPLLKLGITNSLFLVVLQGVPLHKCGEVFLCWSGLVKRKFWDWAPVRRLGVGNKLSPLSIHFLGYNFLEQNFHSLKVAKNCTKECSVNLLAMSVCGNGVSFLGSAMAVVLNHSDWFTL